MSIDSHDKPTFGGWLRHKCEPPCDLMRIAEAQARRREMTKMELLLSFEQADEAWLNQDTELEMSNAYIDTLEKHLQSHGCEHDLATVADAGAQA